LLAEEERERGKGDREREEEEGIDPQWAPFFFSNDDWVPYVCFSFVAT
jgi:hypothetical protein